MRYQPQPYLSRPLFLRFFLFCLELFFPVLCLVCPVVKEKEDNEEEKGREDAPHLGLMFLGCHPYLLEELIAGHDLYEGPEDRAYERFGDGARKHAPYRVYFCASLFPNPSENHIFAVGWHNDLCLLCSSVRIDY